MNYDREGIQATHGIFVGAVVGAIVWTAAALVWAFA